MKFLKKCLDVAMFLVLSVAMCSAQPAAITQHRAMHWIILVDRDTDGDIARAAGCTANAVAPDVLLTAEHCNLDNTNEIYLDVDKTMVRGGTAHRYTITQKYFDHEDHMLIVIPGAHFSSFLSMKTRYPRQGERLHFWGNPAGIQDQYRETLVTGQTQYQNDSDDEDTIDASGTMFLFTGPVVGGDSGSALLAEDGTVVAIITFGIENGQFGGAFPLAFTQQQIAQATK